MSWPTAALSEVAEVVSGGTPKSSVKEYWGGDIPWVTPKDLSDLTGAYIKETPRTISNLGLDKSSANILPANSVLFSSRAPIGHVAINAVPMATNQGFKSFVPVPDRLDSKYLYHWLKANRSYLESLGNGATFKEVSKAVVSAVEIPLPPLPEQRRIAAILDHADALRAKRRETISRLRELVQSAFVDCFGNPEPGWKVRPLADVVDPSTIVTYGIVQAGDEFQAGVPYIRTGDIVDGEIQTNKLRHTDPAIASKFSRSAVDAGDIVMSIRATVGTTAMVPPCLQGANLTQGTARIAPGRSVEGLYLLEYLRTSSTQQWIQRQVKGATFREITLSKLRELPVLVPDKATQRRFVDFASQVAATQTGAGSSNAELDSLFSSLQSRAFRGEL